MSDKICYIVIIQKFKEDNIYDIMKKNLVAFVSDGAPVMIGKHIAMNYS